MIKTDIITGFLGSGKTTFIKRYIQKFKDPAEKIVIIENEFGPENIDGTSLSSVGASVFEITNGCLCCTMKGAFENALLSIAQQQPDRIIIEPTGLFTLSEFYRLLENEQIAKVCQIGAVITIIDAKHYLKDVKRYGLFFDMQVRQSRTMLLSKSKDISAEQISSIEERLRERNPNAQLILKDFLELDKEDFDHIFLGDAQDFTPNLSQIAEKTSGHENIKAIGVDMDRQLTPGQIKKLSLLFTSGALGKIIRAKGFIPTPDGIVEYQFTDGQAQIKPIQNAPKLYINIIGENMIKSDCIRAIEKICGN